MYFVQHTQRGPRQTCIMYEQTFSQYSKWKKCSTKWRTYEFTAEKWEIKLLSIVTELSQLLSFCLSTLLNRRRERTQANTWNTKHNRPRTKNTISLHIVRSWCLKPFSDHLMRTCFTCTSKQRGPGQTHKTQSTTGSAQRTQLVYASLNLDPGFFVIMGKRHTKLHQQCGQMFIG